MLTSIQYTGISKKTTIVLRYESKFYFLFFILLLQCSKTIHRTHIYQAHIRHAAQPYCIEHCFYSFFYSLNLFHQLFQLALILFSFFFSFIYFSFCSVNYVLCSMFCVVVTCYIKYSFESCIFVTLDQRRHKSLHFNVTFVFIILL